MQLECPKRCHKRTFTLIQSEGTMAVAKHPMEWNGLTIMHGRSSRPVPCTAAEYRSKARLASETPGGPLAAIEAQCLAYADDPKCDPILVRRTSGIARQIESILAPPELEPVEGLDEAEQLLARDPRLLRISEGGPDVAVKKISAGERKTYGSRGERHQSSHRSRRHRVTTSARFSKVRAAGDTNPRV